MSQVFHGHLVGANNKPVVRKELVNEFVENYYLSYCPNGITAKSYERVVLENVYPGIDWVLYSKGMSLKYDFVVHPGADPGLIRLSIDGPSKFGVNEAGELYISSSLGRVKEDRPVSYVGANVIATSFTTLDDKTFGFKLAAFDHSQQLTIDPSVTWSTYVGGTGSETKGFSAADSAGNIFVTGNTVSADFPVTTGSYQTNIAGGTDGYVMKFSPSGTLLWATYYGGSSTEQVTSCAASEIGNLIFMGYTNSINLPVSASAFQSSKINGTNNSDAFVVRLNTLGTMLWATYFGGSNNDYAGGCAVDSLNNVLLTGYTYSSNFPVTPQAVQGSIASNTCDAFVAKMDSVGNLIWSTYYGGTSDEYSQECSVDHSGNIFITGMTNSANFPVLGAFQNVKSADYDAFIVKFSPAGNVSWSSFYGGGGTDYAYDCATDSSGNVFFTGYTSSTSFPVSANATQSANAGSSDCFIVKFDSNGTRKWATYYGGSGAEYATKCAVDRFGSIIVSGYTYSTDFPTQVTSLQMTNKGVYDAYIIKLGSRGNKLWSTYYGGGNYDYGEGCTVDRKGNIILTGSTSSSDFPTVSGFQSSFVGGIDGFVWTAL